jgi:hypothetical protein
MQHSARGYSHSPHRSIMPPPTRVNQQNHGGITYSKSEELQRISPLDAIGKAKEKEEQDGQSQPQQEEDVVALVAMARNSSDITVSDEVDQSPRPAKRQRAFFYHDPSPEPD